MDEEQAMDATSDKDRMRGGNAAGGPALLLKAEEAARLLNLGRSTVFAMLASGELRAVRRGRAVRVERSELERWIREQGRAT